MKLSCERYTCFASNLGNTNALEVELELIGAMTTKETTYSHKVGIACGSKQS